MNTPSPIDLTALSKALAVLEEAIAYWHAQAHGSGLKPHLRSAVIQSFEFSYELSLRFLRRVLMERAITADRVADLSFNDLLRLAADAALVPDPLQWRRWRDLRNRTSHSYDEQQALEVATGAEAFLRDAKSLLSRLETEING